MSRPLPLFLLCLASLGLVFLPACGDDKGGGDATTHGSGGGGGEGGGDGSGQGSGDGSGRAAASAGLDDALAERVAAAMAKGRAFLLTQQEDSGGFTDRATEKMQANVSFTAMAVAALVAATPRTEVGSNADIRRGLEFLVKFQNESGAIADNPQWTNYSTSASISALAAARIGEFRANQSKAMAYLAGSQITDEGAAGSFGGFPYKDGQTADGSNAFIAAAALDAGGLPKDSPVRERVGRFASNLQNRSENGPLETKVTLESGEERTVVRGDDGGGYYRVGESKAGMSKRSDGTWEYISYGSMTYAVLKLMLFAGIPADDPRVVALVEWISAHWTVDRNPGFEHEEDPETAGKQGYFYYLHTVARALDAYEQATGKPLVVRDADGRKHDWRREVAQALLARQDDDGSWQNSNPRWMEGMKTLATAFNVQTLGIVSGD